MKPNRFSGSDGETIDITLPNGRKLTPKKIKPTKPKSTSATVATSSGIVVAKVKE